MVIILNYCLAVFSLHSAAVLNRTMHKRTKQGEFKIGQKEGMNMNLSFFDIFWILLLAFSLWPLFKQKNIGKRRFKMIKYIEKKRKSRVITIIHRQEQISIVGLPLARYINIEDSEQVLRAISTICTTSL